MTTPQLGRIPQGKNEVFHTVNVDQIRPNSDGLLNVESLVTKTAAIAAATVVTNAQSGTVFAVSQVAAYAITLPGLGPPIIGPTPGVTYKFVLRTTGANSVTITDGSAHFIGTIANDVTSVLPATGTTLTFVTGTAALGDSIEITGLNSTTYAVKAITSTNGGITIA